LAVAVQVEVIRAAALPEAAKVVEVGKVITLLP
jgi:hypothetical protein